ncbi:MAG: DUF6482 family protein [Halopseudomonas sp.]|uniref:DUF6482 family protein n=1 Tax=Halopseudomonas sp. TaxID=2901191 RepID=UPI003002C934
MKLKELLHLATQGKIRELELLSLEGGIYLLRAHLAEQCRTLQDERGKAMHLRSSTHLRDLLRELPRGTPPPPCVLVQHVVHDEMCGVRNGVIAPLRMPISLASAW